MAERITLVVLSGYNTDIAPLHGVAPNIRVVDARWKLLPEYRRSYPLAWASRALPPPRETPDPPLADLAELDDAAFRRRFRGLPVSRAKRRGLLRSVLLAMGNSADARLRPILERFASDRDELLAEQARWSLARLSEKELK